MFIMRYNQGQEMGADIDQTSVDAWNKMHAGYWSGALEGSSRNGEG